MKTKYLLLLAVLAGSSAHAETFTATWDHPTPDQVSHYNTQYRFDGSFAPEKATQDGFAFAGQVTELTNTFEATPPADATQVTFRVRACNNEGCSDWLSVTAPLPAGVPAQVVNINLTITP